MIEIKCSSINSIRLDFDAILHTIFQIYGCVLMATIPIRSSPVRQSISEILKKIALIT